MTLPRTFRAAVLHQTGAPLRIEAPPGPEWARLSPG